MICAWCKNEIMPYARYYAGEHSGVMHPDCVPFFLADMARYEFAPETCAEMLGMEEKVNADNDEGYGDRKRRATF